MSLDLLSRVRGSPFAGIAVIYIFVSLVFSRQFFISFSQFNPWDVAAVGLQPLWRFTHGHGLTNTLLDGHLLNSRVSPFLYLIVPIYALVPSYYTINFLGILAMLVGGYAIYQLFCHRYGTRAGQFAAVALLFYPYAFPLVPQGFRPLTFTAASMAVMLYYYEVDNRRGYLASGLFCITTHMLGAILVGMTAVWYYLVRRRDLAHLLLAPVIAGYKIVVDALFPSSNYTEGGLGLPFGDSIGSIVVGGVTHPLIVVRTMVASELKLLWAAGVVAVLGFAPLFTTYLGIPASYIIVNLIQDRVWAVVHPLKQRGVLLAVMLLFAVYLGLPRYESLLKRLRSLLGIEIRVTRTRIVGVLAFTVVVCTIVSTTATLGVVTENHRYKYDQPMVVSEHDRAAWNLIEQIPNDAPVKTTYMYTLALAEREEIRKFPQSGRYPRLTKPAYILLDTRVDWVPGPSDMCERRVAAVVESENTEVVDRDNGIVLLSEKTSHGRYWNESIGCAT